MAHRQAVAIADLDHVVVGVVDEELRKKQAKARGARACWGGGERLAQQHASARRPRLHVAGARPYAPPRPPPSPQPTCRTTTPPSTTRCSSYFMPIARS